MVREVFEMARAGWNLPEDRQSRMLQLYLSNYLERHGMTQADVLRHANRHGYPLQRHHTSRYVSQGMVPLNASYLEALAVGLTDLPIVHPETKAHFTALKRAADMINDLEAAAENKACVPLLKQYAGHDVLAGARKLLEKRKQELQMELNALLEMEAAIFGPEGGKK
jgi:hypothetical protein